MRLSAPIAPIPIRRSLGPWTLALFALAAVGAAAPAPGGMIEPEWLARYDSNNGFDRTNAMAVTADGVYIAGDSDNGNFLSEDIFVAHYDLEGELVWASTYVGPEGGRDRGLAIAVAPTGEVFVSGVSWGGESSREDIVTILYGADGVEQWVRRWVGEFHQTDRPMAIALDNAGDVYVTGSTFEAGTAWDYSTVKYRGSDGELLWNRTYDHSGSIDECFAIAAGEDGVCIGGHARYAADGTSWDAFVIKYPGGGTSDVIDSDETVADPMTPQEMDPASFSSVRLAPAGVYFASLQAGCPGGERSQAGGLDSGPQGRRVVLVR